VHAHHARGKKAHPELRHVTVNGVACCDACHKWAHKNPLDFRAWFQARRAQDYLILFGEGA
jgi:hypothetical protein